MNNTRARSDEIQAAARALLLADAWQLDEQAITPDRVARLIEQTQCHADTAKRHIAKAARLMRGEAAAAWGGARPGAGRPKD